MAEKYSLDDYEQVDARLRRTYTDFPNARVLTDLVFRDERSFIIKAFLYLDPTDPTPFATGFAEEIVGAGFVNKTSALENCETSAIGRAISNSVLILGAPVGKRPSAQEMEKVQRYKEEPRKTPTVAKREYSQSEIDLITAMMESVKTITDKEELRQMWSAYSDLLEAPVLNTTLKDVINARVGRLS